MENAVMVAVIFAFAAVGGLGLVALASRLVLAAWDDQAASRKLRAPLRARVLRRRQ